MERDELVRLSGKARAGDFGARNAIVEAYLPLVVHVARRTAPRMDLDDKVQAGSLGLMGAAAGLDGGRGDGFTSYMIEKIRGAILDENERDVPIRVPRKAGKSGRWTPLNRVPLMPDDWRAGREDRPPEDGPSPAADDAAAVLASLKPAERDVFVRRHGLDGHPCCTFGEIAAQLGSPFATVQSRYTRAMRRLRLGRDPGAARRPTPGRRGGHYIELDGIRLSVAEWGRRMGISRSLIVQRLSRGKSEREAVMTPARPRRSRAEAV